MPEGGLVYCLNSSALSLLLGEEEVLVIVRSLIIIKLKLLQITQNKGKLTKTSSVSKTQKNNYLCKFSPPNLFRQSNSCSTTDRQLSHSLIVLFSRNHSLLPTMESLFCLLLKSQSSKNDSLSYLNELKFSAPILIDE